MERIGLPSPATLAPAGPANADSAHTTMLCASITADDVAGALDEIALARSCGADILELRLDFYADFEPDRHLQALLDACGAMPCIVTCRPAWEGCASQHGAKLCRRERGRRRGRRAGSPLSRSAPRLLCRGRWRGSEDKRTAILQRAAASGAAYIDVEIEAADAGRAAEWCPPAGPCRLILSHHNFERTLSESDLLAVEARMRAAGAAVCKLAMMATDIADAWTVLSVLKARSGADAGQAGRGLVLKEAPALWRCSGARK